MLLIKGGNNGTQNIMIHLKNHPITVPATWVSPKSHGSGTDSGRSFSVKVIELTVHIKEGIFHKNC